MITRGGDGVFATPFNQKTGLTQDFKELVPTDTEVRQMLQKLTAPKREDQLA